MDAYVAYRKNSARAMRHQEDRLHAAAQQVCFRNDKEAAHQACIEADQVAIDIEKMYQGVVRPINPKVINILTLDNERATQADAMPTATSTATPGTPSSERRSSKTTSGTI